MKRQSSKRVASLLMILMLTLGMWAGLAVPSMAADKISDSQSITLTCAQKPSTSGYVFFEIEKYTKSSTLKDVELVYGEIPPGMKWGYNEAQEVYLRDIPTNTGNYYSNWNINLVDGTVINYGLSVTVNPAKTIDSSQDVTLKLNQSATTSFDISQYNTDSSYQSCELVKGDIPPGMKWISGEIDAPRIYNAPTGAGTYHSLWKVVLSNGTQINHTLNVTVEPEKTITSSQDINLEFGKNVSVSFTVDKGDASFKACHLESGEIPYGMDYISGEVDAPRLIKTPTVPGTYTSVWDITLDNGTLIKHTINATVAPTKEINSSQTISLINGERTTAYFDVEKYKTDTWYEYCELVSGEIPNGMDWIYGEIEAPRIYGTPTGKPDTTSGGGKAKYTTANGTYVSEWKVTLGDGTQINHTITAIVTSDGNPFEDVAANDFFYKAVLWAVGHDPQITNGVDTTHFAPGNTCTRGQVVTFLWRAMGCPEPKGTANSFVDVKEGQFFYDAVLWAVEKGITNGMDPTHFGPDLGCTRGQVVTFLWRTEGSPAPGSSTNPFTDVNAEAFYYQPVLWAVEQGITNGTSETTFSPEATCTRGQIVTFLYRDMGPVNDLVKNDFLMYVEDVFMITGRGVVATGRVTSGKVKVGDTIRILTFDSETKEAVERTTTVTGIEMFHKTLDEAEAGDNIGLLISLEDKSLIQRGDCLVGENVNIHGYTGKFIGTLRLATKYDGGRHTPIFNNYKPQFYIGTTDFTGVITGITKEFLSPGETASNIEVNMTNNPVVVYPGQEITIREGGRTVGTFTVKSVEP